MKHQDKVDPEGAEPKKKVRVAEAQAKRDVKETVRYHGSTNVAMLLHTDNERIKSNIRKFVRVSPEVIIWENYM